MTNTRRDSGGTSWTRVRGRLVFFSRAVTPTGSRPTPIRPGVGQSSNCALRRRFKPPETLLLRDRLQIGFAYHAAVTHEDHRSNPNRVCTLRTTSCTVVVDAVALPHVMGDRPAGDHHHAHDDLDVLRLAVAAVAVLGEIFGPAPSK